MNSNKVIFEVKNLKYSYPGDSKLTLNISEFHINRGDRLFLHGPSGSGKTTLLEILAGVLLPQEGEVHAMGLDFMAMSTRERDEFRAEHMGYVFQNFNLLPYLTVQENVELPLQLSPARRARLKSVDSEMVIRALCGTLGIADLLKKNVNEISVGQQQRVAVARALLGKPDILLADEPTSALDADHREKFLRLLFEMADLYGTTVVFVSHDRGIEPLFSRTVSLNQINKVNV